MRSTPPESLKVYQRPGDKVRSYIIDLAHQISEPRRLPTMRSLAIQLEVSLATVYNTYQDLKKEEFISTRKGDGSFILPTKKRGSTASQKTRWRIYLNHIPHSDEGITLLGSYYAALMQEVMKGNLQFDFSVLDAETSQEGQVAQLHRAGQLDAMIIFPFMPCQPLVDACERGGIPYITLHPASPQAATNFVTPDFFQAGVALGKAWAAGGRSRLAYLTDGILESSTAWAWASGVSCGFLELNRPLHLERVAFGIDWETKAAQWLDERKHSMPDAILCHRHGTLKILHKLLKERGITVPHEVSLVTTIHRAPSSDTTETHLVIPFSKIARTALDRLQSVLEGGTSVIPAVRVDARFAGGATTMVGESVALGIL